MPKKTLAPSVPGVPSAPVVPKGEHIFPASQLTPLAVKWKELYAAGRHKEAMLVLEQIVVGSTAMFERLAQYEDFHYTVDLPILVSAAQEKVIKWLIAWQPKKGRLFSWFSKSYAGSTYVLLADGSCRKISDIVDNREQCSVLSWNRTSNCFEPKPVIDWIKEPMPDVNDWRRLWVKPSEGNQPSNKQRDGTIKRITLTKDHEVYTDRGIVRVDELAASDKLYICRPSITPNGMSAAIGMYLGDATITKKGHLVIAHGTGQKAYTEHVASKFGGREVWENEVTLRWKQVATGNNIQRKYPVYRTRILIRRLWKNFPLSKDKKITEWLLDNINPIVLAYWYMDDGFLIKAQKKSSSRSPARDRYFPAFCSENFTFEECARIGERLFVEWGLETWIGKERVKDGITYGRIFVKDASVPRFFEMVAPYVLPCFDYKIPVEFRSIPKKDIELVRYEAVPCAEFSVKKFRENRASKECLESLRYKYDITVSDNHNIVVTDNGKTQKGTLSGICACQCAKNSFRSELVKVNQYRKRYHVTSDNLEKFYGAEDHEIDKHDMVTETYARLKHIFIRWGDPQEQGALRYLVNCIVDEEHDKQAAIRTAAYAWGISLDLAKFFYAQAVVKLRHVFHDKVYIPFTQVDLERAGLAYEPIADMYEYFPAEAVRRWIIDHQGMRIKVPTAAFLNRLHENYALYRELDKTALDPDSVAEIARKRKRTIRSAQEIFNEMVQTLDPRRSGEHGLFDEDEYNQY